jgi:hypothetical protein
MCCAVVVVVAGNVYCMIKTWGESEDAIIDKTAKTIVLYKRNPLLGTRQLVWDLSEVDEVQCNFHHLQSPINHHFECH